VLVAGRASPVGQNPYDEAVDRFAAGVNDAVTRLTSGRTYSAVRKELDDVLSRWDRQRRPAQGGLLLELVREGFNQQSAWQALDVLEKAQKFMAARPDPPGRNPREDAIEILWHKATVSLLFGYQNPPMLESAGIEPIGRRISPTAGTPQRPMLVDPWIALMRGVLQEHWTILDPSQLGRRGPRALERFAEAARFPETRLEALVRRSAVLVRLNRASEALTTLDLLPPNEAADDPSVRYWALLLRGKALEAVGQPVPAAAAYSAALRLAPEAHAPRAALAALDMLRGEQGAAFRWAAGLQTAPGTPGDPWVRYGSGDYRFYKSRLLDLREAR
jgi:tetratricopeptide (TPR) repeat protein